MTFNVLHWLGPLGAANDGLVHAAGTAAGTAGGRSHTSELQEAALDG